MSTLSAWSIVGIVDSHSMKYNKWCLLRWNDRLRRRKKNVKTLRKPIYAIETRTDVDIMDDGFKWRKYGQKAVKNSPYPRYIMSIPFLS